MSGLSLRRPLSSSPAGAARNAGSAEMLMLAIERVQSALDAENTQIASGRRVDFQAFNLRKSQGLLELTRLMPVLAGVEVAANVRAALVGLRAKLEENQRTLRVQLKAVQEVSDIIARTIHAGQSDGTYSAYSWRD
jgi:hypothetical protein